MNMKANPSTGLTVLVILNVGTPDAFGSEWQLRAQLTFLFPEKK